MMDKMREDFEEWWIKNMNAIEMDLHRFGDGYSCHETNRGWMAWQASRVALCVVLPEVRVLDGGRIAEIGYELAVDDFELALDSAGVRYK